MENTKPYEQDPQVLQAASTLMLMRRHHPTERTEAEIHTEPPLRSHSLDINIGSPAHHFTHRRSEAVAEGDANITFTQRRPLFNYAQDQIAYDRYGPMATSTPRPSNTNTNADANTNAAAAATAATTRPEGEAPKPSGPFAYKGQVYPAPLLDIDWENYGGLDITMCMACHVDGVHAIQCIVFEKTCTRCVSRGRRCLFARAGEPWTECIREEIRTRRHLHRQGYQLPRAEPALLSAEMRAAEERADDILTDSLEDDDAPPLAMRVGDQQIRDWRDYGEAVAVEAGHRALWRRNALAARRERAKAAVAAAALLGASSALASGDNHGPPTPGAGDGPEPGA